MVYPYKSNTDSAYNKVSAENKEILMSDVTKTKCIKRQENYFALLAYMVRRDTPKPNAQGDCIDFARWQAAIVELRIPPALAIGSVKQGGKKTRKKAIISIAFFCIFSVKTQTQPGCFSGLKMPARISRFSM